MEPDLMTVTDAADRLGVTRSVITYLCQRGDLRSFTTPGGPGPTGYQRWILREDVERLQRDGWRRQRGPQPKRKKRAEDAA